MFNGILQNYNVKVWHEFIWLMTKCMNIIMNPVSTEGLRISWPAEQL